MLSFKQFLEHGKYHKNVKKEATQTGLNCSDSKDAYSTEIIISLLVNKNNSEQNLSWPDDQS